MKKLLEQTREKVAILTAASEVRDSESEFEGLVPYPSTPVQQPNLASKPHRGAGRVYNRSTTHHPALLDEINDLISDGLKRLERERQQQEGRPEDEQEENGVGYESETSFQSDRLLIYRAAFQRFMDESLIYKPFLQAFIREYDQCVESLRAQLRALASVRLEMPTQQAQAASRMRDLSSEHNQRNDELQRRIIQLENNLAATERKLSMSQTEFQEYRESSEKMRRQWEEMRVSCIRLTSSLARHDEDAKRNKVIDAARQAEFVAAKINEKKAQEQAERLTLILQEMEAVQSTLITKEAVEQQVATIASLRADLKKNENVHRDLINRYSTLKAAIEEAYSVPSNAAANAPSHAPLSVPVGLLATGKNGGQQQQLTKDNIRVAIERLLDQIKELKVALAITESQIASDEADKEQLDDANSVSGDIFRSSWSHFEGLGMHPSIPAYLRTVGKVQNFFMSRRDTAKLIKDIMGACFIAEQQRVAAEEQLQAKNSVPTVGIIKGVGDPFSVFFARFLQDKYGSGPKATEVAYNLTDCLKKYAQESDCRLFALILDDALPADVWFDLHATLASLLSALKAEEARQAVGKHGAKLTVESVLRMLRKTFPNKTEQSVGRVARALVLETTSNRFVDLDRCLGEHDFSWSLVSEELRQQYINETIEFFDSITESVDKCREMPSDTTSNVGSLRAALVFCDPKKARSEINAYLSRGCGVSLEQMLIMEAKRTEVRLDAFLGRLKRGLLKKS